MEYKTKTVPLTNKRDMEQVKNWVLNLSVLFVNGAYLLSKSNITWGLGIVVSLLAIVNYYLQIKKNLKSK